MTRFGHYSLTLQLPLIASATALILGLSLLWLASTASLHVQEEQERRYGNALAQQLADSLREPLQSGDLLAARASLERFFDSSMASRIVVRDVEGSAIGSAERPDAEDRSFAESRSYSAVITISGDIAGEVAVAIDRTATQETRWRFVFSLLSLTLGLALAVFLGTRLLAQRLATRLRALESELALPGEQTDVDFANELERLEHSVALLPLDMLRGHAPVPKAAAHFQDNALLFVHLASLARYVDTLSESNLHRYARRLQQLVQAAAHCYRGELVVSRPFGILLSFAPQPNAGSEALRAACCARLIAELTRRLGKRTNLSLDLAMAIGVCEEETEGVDDIYPQLHKQGVIDELGSACLGASEHPLILVDESLDADEQLAAVAVYREAGETRSDGASLTDSLRRLERLGDEQESLLRHQAQLIAERIAPRREAD
ncbi:MAG: hypothetical protein V2I82_09175 [Halieaceae bacterium]|jgi:hypothetical protein|nr:hypothetical protein [Halieaceae bacterium]